MSRFEQLENAVIKPSEYQAPGGVEATDRFKLTRGHWILFALGLLCLLFIAFITVARSVQFTTVTANLSNPGEMLLQPAEVSIHSWVKLPIGNRVLLLPGEHLISASAAGFETTEQALQIGGERHQQIEITLLPLAGKLQIDLQPAVQAEVLLDGVLIGQLPGLIENVPAGKHQLSIDAPLYRAHSQELLVQGREITEQLSVSLQPAWAEVSIASNPAGATVLIDGVAQGATPVSIKLEEGNRSLAVTADKFKPYQQQLVVVAQQDLALPDIELKPADGILNIITEPPAAAVIVNGAFRGISPINLKLPPEQAHQVQVYKAGYRLLDEQLSLAPQQTVDKQFGLQADLVPVQISVSPSDAEVFIDGVRRGSGSQTVSINTLPHNISVRKKGYVTYNSQIIATKGNRQVVSVNLLTREQHFWANIPDTYVTQAGQSMKLFKSPGQVRLGSSRREAGRRANEVKYTARLNRHFYVSRHEVTNKQFRQFQPAHSSGNYKKKSLDSNKHPVVNISWQQAALYCNWLSKKEKLTPFYQTKAGYVSGQNVDANGYRLLTEVEWAWLARNKGDGELLYPWGRNSSPTGSHATGNYADTNAASLIAFTLPGYDDGYTGTAPIGRFPANHRGLYDLDGNVAEWVNDWYSAKGNLDSGVDGKLEDPMGPAIGEFHVVRGASWARGHLPQLRLAYRDFGAKGKHDVGFRLARYVGTPQ